MTAPLCSSLHSQVTIVGYRKSSIKPLLGGLIYFKHIFPWGQEPMVGLNNDGGLFEGWGRLFNLAKTTVLVLRKELEYIVEKHQYRKLEVMQRRIKNKSKLPAGE